MQQPGFGLAVTDRHVQGITHQLSVVAVAHGPAHYLSGVQVNDGGQIQPALSGGDEGGVGDPGLIRLIVVKRRFRMLSLAGSLFVHRDWP